MTVSKNGKEYTLSLKRRFTINVIPSCVEAIVSGLGVGVLPASKVLSQHDSLPIVRIMGDFKLLSASLYAIYCLFYFF